MVIVKFVLICCTKSKLDPKYLIQVARNTDSGLLHRKKTSVARFHFIWEHFPWSERFLPNKILIIVAGNSSQNGVNSNFLELEMFSPEGVRPIMGSEKRGIMYFNSFMENIPQFLRELMFLSSQ